MAKSKKGPGVNLPGFLRAEGAWVALLLFAFTFGVAWHQMTHPELMPMTAADTGIHYPFKVYWIRSLLEGHPALWNPYVALGIPFVAHPSVGAFSPFNLLFLALRDNINYAFAWENFLHLWLAALGVYALLKTWGCRWEAGVVGGMAFAFQGFMNTHHWFGQFSMPLAACWFPWILLCLHQSVARGRLAWLLGASACTALSFFEGYPQIAYYAMLICGLYLLGCWWRRMLDFQGVVLHSLAYVLSFLLLALCLLAPFLQFTHQSNRSEWGFDFVMSDFQTPDNPNSLLRPFYAGNPIKGDYSEEGHWSYTESAIYIGVAPFLLFVLGLFLAAKKGWGFALGMTGGVLATLGVLGWATTFSGPPLRDPSPWLARIDLVLLLLLGAGTVLAAKKSRLYAWLGAMALLFYLLSMGRSTHPTLWLFKLFYNVVPGFGLSRSISRLNIITTFCLVLGAGLTLDQLVRSYLLPKKPGSGSKKRFPLYPLVLALVALTGFDLWRYASPFFTAKPFGFWEPKNIFPNPLIQEVLDDKSLPRIQPMNWVNANILFKITQVKGSDMMYLKEAGHFRQKLEENYDNPLADLIRLRYIQTEQKDLDKGGRWRMAQKNYYLHYVNDKVLPRCFLVGKAQPSPDPQSSVMTIQKGWSDPAQQVLLTGKTVPFVGEPGYLGEPTSLVYRDDLVAAQVDVPRPCYLFLSDNIYPGWMAQVDGKSVPLYEANGPFRAVYLPEAGKHEVRMVYRNKPLLLGLAVSAPAWLLAVLVWIFGRGIPLSWPGPLAVWAPAVLGSASKPKNKKKGR